MKKCFVVVVLVLVVLAGVLCEASFADIERCPDCGGSGKERCDICRGSGTCVICYGRGTVGYVPDYTGQGRGHDIICTACNGTRKCWRCNGYPITTCHTCGGTGRIDTTYYYYQY